MAATRLKSGKGVEVMSFDFPAADNLLVHIALDALCRGGKLPRGIRVRRCQRDIYLTWGSGRFIFLRLH